MSQPFVYIFAVLVIGLILVFGFGQVKKLLDFGNDVEDIKFQQDLQKLVDDTYTLAHGSSALIDRSKLVPPSSIRGLCFIDATRAVDVSKIPFRDVREEIEITGSSRRNVFFSVRGDSGLLPLSIEHLQAEEVVCFDLSVKQMEFILENKGSYVGLSSYAS